MEIILNKILNTNIWKIVLAIFIIELFSLISYSFSLLSGVYFVLILVLVLLFSLYKIEYGLYFALIELMIGSQGYLFYLFLGDFKVSIRLGIFIVVFLVWLFKYFAPSKYLRLLKKDRLFQNFILFLIFLAFGIVNGFFHGNGLKNIFFDMNGYLYFGLFFIFIDVFQNKNQLIDFMKIFFASLIYVCLKIFLTLYFFTHPFTNIANVFYTWIRDTRVGEITWAGNGFYRIFLQSQIFSLVAIFIIITLLAYLLNKKVNKQSVLLLLILIIIQTSILISFSRTFWLGGLSGGFCLLVYLIFILKLKLKKLAKIIGAILGAGIVSIVLMIVIVEFPLPLSSGSFSASMLEDRLTTISGEAGVSSRWNLLPVLINKNKQNLILGTGFGSTVTYQTEDPRIKNEKNPEGWYETYSFEWGYLDTITEIGVIGLLVYLLLIGQILLIGIKAYKSGESKYITAGFLIGLVVVLVTNFFSPYLNHPLGIGYLMISYWVFQITNKNSHILLKS